MTDSTQLLAALPVAVYTTDAEGHITFYNDAAAELWGHRPVLGTSRWCGSWRLFWPDGRPMRPDECPMAVSLREGRPIRGVEAQAERPDGTRIRFRPYPTPLIDDSGKVVGGINLLVDVTDQRHGEIEAARLAAIVESSDDAIISKTLDGRITSWNAGATRIFGYEAAEMIGESIIKIIPTDLRDEEVQIVARLKRGERTEHFDTVRVAKDGRRLNISVTVSPLRDGSGTVVGASKIARDISERKQADELQRLLFDELNHRVKNTLATIQAIARQSLNRAASPSDFVPTFTGRVQALARAHDLLVQSKMRGANLSDVIREQVLLGAATDARVHSSGPAVPLDARVAVHLALVLHELATNARKYGALSVPTGRLSISWTVQTNGGRELSIEWKETGVPNVSAPTFHGFGTTLIERTLEANGGTTSIRYDVGGVTCEIRLPLAAEPPTTIGAAALARFSRDLAFLQETGRANLVGKRILLIEDEPLVAMDIEAELQAAGCVVVGPAGNLAAAKRLIREQSFDAALVDANLGGEPVDELAAAVTKKAVPFAFATGYAREALPLGFRDAPILVKPFSHDQFLATIEELLSTAERGPLSVVPFERGRV